MPDRTRSPLRPSLLALCLLATAPLFAFGHRGPRVRVASGRLQGALSTDGQVVEYLGIPYAAPPVGPLRWQPPQPVAAWRGTRSATQFGARCMQPHFYPDMYFRDPGPSEDCLTLNIWRPAHAASKHLPVMVWIFGGGFITGGTSEPRQDGTNLARHGVIVVSMNYRLGIFGFFAHPALAAESPQKAAGNYGLMDQAAALRWVRQNIHAFGGDPKNVTIFGESAGSISVSAQMAAPGSIGLFAHAMGESGGAFRAAGRSWPSLVTSERRGTAFAQWVCGACNLAQLRAMPATTLMDKAIHWPHGGLFAVGWPNVDGYFLPQSPAAIYAAGKQAHVPLLAGWNRDEGAFAMAGLHLQPDLAGMQTLAQKDFGADAPEWLKVYHATSDPEAGRAILDYEGDRFIAYSTWEWLEQQVKTGGAPVYRYRFDQPSPGDPNHPASLGAFHSDDIEYVFGNLDSRRGAHWRPEDYKLSKEMQTYWVNFAATGNPNGAGLPDWPQYSAPEWQVMHLAPVSQARPDQHRARYSFLQKEWGVKPNQASTGETTGKG